MEGRNTPTSIDVELEQRVRFLRSANVDGLKHSERGLLDHLLGTRELLRHWGARPALCDAGLFHRELGSGGNGIVKAGFDILAPGMTEPSITDALDMC